MSISIGIGVGDGSEELFEKSTAIAASLGYALLKGIASFEADVQDGIRRLSALQKWKDVYCLKSPATTVANLAFGVYQELVAFQTSGVPPKFFDLCKAIDEIARTLGHEKLGVFFATEWYAEDRIRVSYGNIERLLFMLGLPGHCMVSILNPQTGRVEEWDELPFFFDLDCR